MRYHRSVSARHAPGDPLRPALADPPPTDEHEFALYLQRVYAAVVKRLRRGLNEQLDPWIKSADCAKRIRVARNGIGLYLQRRIESINKEKLEAPWVTYAALSLLLLRVGAAGERAVLTKVQATQLLAARCTFLPPETVARYSLRELVDAIAVLRSRLLMITTDISPALIYMYAEHLLLRTSEFILGMASDPNDYDDPVYVTEGSVNSVFLTSSATWFSFMWRYLESARRHTYPVFTPDNMQADTAWTFLKRAASSRDKLEHQEAHMKAVKAQWLAPGELIVHAKLFGIGGIERPGPDEVFQRSTPPVAAAYCAREAFYRPMIDWFTDAEHDAWGGAQSETWLQQLTVLYLFDALLKYECGFSFLSKFVFTVNKTGPAFERQIATARLARIPFLFQRLGAFVVWISPTQSYICQSALHALIAWAEGVLVCDALRVEHGLRAFLRHFLTGTAPS